MNRENISARLEEIFGGIVAVLFLLLFLFAGYLAVVNIFDWNKCEETKTVKDVGGCGLFGKCGVLFDDGTYGDAKYPIASQRVCVKKSFYKISEDSFPIQSYNKFKRKKKKINEDEINFLRYCNEGNKISCGYYGLDLYVRTKSIELSYRYLKEGCDLWIERKEPNSRLMYACSLLGTDALDKKNYKESARLFEHICQTGLEYDCLMLGSTKYAIGDTESAKQIISKYHIGQKSEEACLKNNKAGSCYNLACYYSINSEIEMSIYFLTRYLNLIEDNNDFVKIENDHDFKNLRLSKSYDSLKAAISSKKKKAPAIPKEI